MKKIIKILLCLSLFMLCIPQNVNAASFKHHLIINYYKNGDYRTMQAIDGYVSEEDPENRIDGLAIEANVKEDEAFYTVHITKKDVSVDFKTSDTISSCIDVINAGFKIVADEDDYGITFNYLGNDTEKPSKNSYVSVIKCTIDPNYPYTYISGFGGNGKLLNVGFYDSYHMTEGNYGVPLNGISVNDDHSQSSKCPYNFSFDRIKSNASLSGAYYTNYVANENMQTTIGESTIFFTNIDAYAEGYTGSEYDRGFMRMNGSLTAKGTTINTYLNGTKYEFPLERAQDVTGQISSTAISTNGMMNFVGSTLYLEGFAGVASRKSILFEDSDVHIDSRCCGVFLMGSDPENYKFSFKSGQGKKLNIETKCTLQLPAIRLDENLPPIHVDAAIVSPYGYNLEINTNDDVTAFDGNNNIPFQSGNIFANPLSGQQEDLDLYLKINSFKGLSCGIIEKPFDFEIRYGVHNYGGDEDYTVSCKYFEGIHDENSAPLPEGVTIDYNPNREYPYVMTTIGTGVDPKTTSISFDINNKFSAEHIADDRDLGYCIYFDKSLLINGVGLNLNLTGDPNEDIYYYGIISRNEDAKLKIDVPYLYVSNNNDPAFYNESIVYGDSREEQYKLPYFYVISAYDVQIDGVVEGNLPTTYRFIEYFDNLSITNSDITSYFLSYKYESDDDYNEEISLISQGESDSSEPVTFTLEDSTLWLDGTPMFDFDNNKLDLYGISSVNFSNISNSNLNVVNSKLECSNVGLKIGNATFEDCMDTDDEHPYALIFNNNVSPLPNITSFGGELVFENCRYIFNNINYNHPNNVGNIEYLDMGEELENQYNEGIISQEIYEEFYPILHADFSVSFEQAEGCYGSFSSDVACINTDKGTVNIGDSTKVMASTESGTMCDIEYNDDDRLLYKSLSVEHLVPRPVLKENSLQIPMLEKDGHLPYYHDEENDIYYSDPEGEHEIGNYEDLQEWINGPGSIAKLNGNSKYTAMIIADAKETPITKFEIPVEDNAYVFKSDLVIKKFACVIVNGAYVDPSNFIINGQSKYFMLRFNDGFLNELPEGKNSIYIAGRDGNAYLEFNVEKKNVDPVNPVDPINPSKPSKPSYNPPKTGIK